MAKKIFHVTREEEYRKAGPLDLIELLPAPGSNVLFIQKWILESLVYAIVHREIIHISGPTGTAKTSLLEALYLVPENFCAICKGLGFPVMPMALFPNILAIYETPGELYFRRALRSGTTYDEKSGLIVSLEKAVACSKDHYPVIWGREMGRVHSSSVQGGLLDLMTKADILLPDGQKIPGQLISWVADSNYQAEQDSTHTLVTFDDALRRRFSVNITLDYYPAELEVVILQHLLSQRDFPGIKKELIRKVVSLGQEIRRHRAQGQLFSVTPPTIYGYLSFLRMAYVMPHFNHQQIAQATLCGNACQDDQRIVIGIVNQVFSIQPTADDKTAIDVDLF